MGNERFVFTEDTETDRSDFFFSSSLSMLIFPLSIILMLKPADRSVPKSTAKTVFWLASLNLHLSGFWEKDTRWEVLGATIIIRKLIHFMHIPNSNSVPWSWVTLSSSMKHPGLWGSAPPEELLLPPDGTVLLAFSSSPALLQRLQPQLGCPWQQLQKKPA